MHYTGNNLACTNCHLEGGTKKYGLPFIGVFGDFPQYRAREGEVGTLEDRINGCMKRSMNGRALPDRSREMVALVAYMKFLSDGLPVGRLIPGRGVATIGLLGRAADPNRGKLVFEKVCHECHGADGQGRRTASLGDVQGYKMPPLWGEDSFNNGAGMARLMTAAGFIRGNMPKGASWDAPGISEEDAWDVAAFIEAQPRPQMAGLEQDYPRRDEKPTDAAYGPYADDSPPEQHKYGPYRAITGD
jgi:thiosulfate dehydrogenase